MKIVIDIPDEMYNTFKRGIWSSTYDGKKIRDIIMNGTPLKKGHWIPRTHIGRGTIQMYVCSNCRQEFGYDAETGIEFIDYNYCPHCGAEMRGDE